MDEVSVPRTRGRPRKRPDAVSGDRAYDADWIRQWCTDKGIESAIPTRENMRDSPGRPPTCDDRRYHDRNTIERCVGHLKERRRLVVRYEKKASHTEATASSHDPLGVRPGIPKSIIIRRSLGPKRSLRLRQPTGVLGLTSPPASAGEKLNVAVHVFVFSFWNRVYAAILPGPTFF